MAKVAYVVVGYDPDPDLSWLENDCHGPEGCDYRDPANHVTLEMTAYDAEGEMIDNLGGIDFLVDTDDWRTGEFHRLSRLPEGYLRVVAQDMGLEEGE